MPEIAIHTSLRASPYYEATIAEGVTAMHPYNRMMIPLGYGDPEAEYRRLVDGVAMWDVGAQRQVQLKGPDAERLAQTLCARDLSTAVVGQGKYVAVCRHDGSIINDPVILKVADDCFWLSIADSDVGLWATCVAAERCMNVEVTEPDVSPLAVQGPMAEDVVASIFGDWVRDLRYFWFGDAEVDGIPLKATLFRPTRAGDFERNTVDFGITEPEVPQVADPVAKDRRNDIFGHRTLHG